MLHVLCGRVTERRVRLFVCAPPCWHVCGLPPTREVARRRRSVSAAGTTGQAGREHERRGPMRRWRPARAATRPIRVTTRRVRPAVFATSSPAEPGDGGGDEASHGTVDIAQGVPLAVTPA